MTKMRKICIATMTCLLFSVSFIIILFFKEYPIIDNSLKNVICTIEYRSNGDLIRAIDYKEEEILAYLSTCTQRRSMSIPRGFYMDDVDISLHIYTYKDKTVNHIHILLGKSNFLYYTAGLDKFQHQIENASEVKATIFKLLECR